MNEDSDSRSGQDQRSGQIGPDLARYLPLSQRPRRDESAVTGDWSKAVSSAVRTLADNLGSASDAAIAAPSLRGGWSVLDVCAWLGWRLSTSRTERTKQIVLGTLVNRSGRADAAFRLAKREAALGVDAVQARLRAVAGARGPRSLSDLSSAILATVDTAGALGVSPAFDPIAAGAVALAQSLSAPLPIRAVLADHTLVAVDGDWRIGAGPATQSTTVPILLFLFARGGLPSAG